MYPSGELQWTSASSGKTSSRESNPPENEDKIERFFPTLTIELLGELKACIRELLCLKSQYNRDISSGLIF